MDVKSAFASGLHTIRNGMDGLGKNASDIARAGTTDPKADATAALVDSKVQQREVEAGAKVVKAADAMMGSLLDEKA